MLPGSPSVAFDQRHFRPIDRNHHARGVGADLNVSWWVAQKEVLASLH